MARILHTFVIGSLCVCVSVCVCACACACVCVRAHVRVRICVLFAHTRGSGLYVFFVFFFSSCSVAWQLSLCFGVPFCWWKWLRTTHTSHISPFFQNYHPFVSPCCLSAALSYLHSAHSSDPLLTCWCFMRLTFKRVCIGSNAGMCVSIMFAWFSKPNANDKNVKDTLIRPISISVH